MIRSLRMHLAARGPRWTHRLLALLLSAAIVFGLVVGLEGLRYHHVVDGAGLAALPDRAPRLVVPSDHARVLLAGDTHFGENYFSGSGLESFLDDHGYAHPLHRLAPLMRSADLVIANLETSLTDRRNSPLTALKTFIHRGDPRRGPKELAAHGVRAVSLANNHSLDLARTGLIDTAAALSAQGIETFGAGATVAQAAQPYRRDVELGAHTLRLAVLGLYEREWVHWWYGFYATESTPGAYGPHPQTIAAQVRALKTADPELFIIVFPHWGRNYRWRTADQQALGHQLIDAGADLVIGHGAHLFQEIERHRESWILYGLGNFMFLSGGGYVERQMHPYSVAAALDLTNGSEGIALELRLYFIASNNKRTGFVPHLLDGDAFQQAAQLLLDRSAQRGQAEQLREQTRIDRDPLGPHLRLELTSAPRQ